LTGHLVKAASLSNMVPSVTLHWFSHVHSEMK
jgi:hypothetical protein